MDTKNIDTENISEYEKILKACREFPSLKRVALSMIDYVEEYLEMAIKNQKDGVYVIKEKDIPEIHPLNDFYYSLFIEMLEDRKEIIDINTDNGDIEIELDLEYISEINGENIGEAQALSM